MYIKNVDLDKKTILMGLIYLRFLCQRNKSHINPKQICGCRISLFSRIANADIHGFRIANSEELEIS